MLGPSASFHTALSWHCCSRFGEITHRASAKASLREVRIVAALRAHTSSAPDIPMGVISRRWPLETFHRSAPVSVVRVSTPPSRPSM